MERNKMKKMNIELSQTKQGQVQSHVMIHDIILMHCIDIEGEIKLLEKSKKLEMEKSETASTAQQALIKALITDIEHYHRLTGMMH